MVSDGDSRRRGWRGSLSKSLSPRPQRGVLLSSQQDCRAEQHCCCCCCSHLNQHLPLLTCLPTPSFMSSCLLSIMSIVQDKRCNSDHWLGFRFSYCERQKKLKDERIRWQLENRATERPLLLQISPLRQQAATLD